MRRIKVPTDEGTQLRVFTPSSRATCVPRAYVIECGAEHNARLTHAKRKESTQVWPNPKKQGVKRCVTKDQSQNRKMIKHTSTDLPQLPVAAEHEPVPCWGRNRIRERVACEPVSVSHTAPFLEGWKALFTEAQPARLRLCWVCCMLKICMQPATHKFSSLLSVRIL